MLDLLTSAEAIMSAMDDADDLGRELFLERYGYRRARGCFVVRGRVAYDAKAIAGVAISKQHPELKLVSAVEFSGGTRTVGAKLRSLGFSLAKDGCKFAAASDAGTRD